MRELWATILESDTPFEVSMSSSSMAVLPALTCVTYISFYVKYHSYGAALLNNYLHYKRGKEKKKKREDIPFVLIAFFFGGGREYLPLVLVVTAAALSQKPTKQRSPGGKREAAYVLSDLFSILAFYFSELCQMGSRFYFF